MNRLFEAHKNPSRSQLEQWRDEITQMRSLNWPYHRIAKWLEDEQSLSVSKEAVRKFCGVRAIEKGTDSQPIRKSEPPVQRIRKTTTKQKFTFDETDSDKPIPVQRK